MAAEIEQKFGLKPEYIKSGGGVFEVIVDGELVFSKKKLGRFPEHPEILAEIEARKS